MNRRLVDMLVWTLWASPLIFFAVSSASLPEHMASHFTEQGVYVSFCLAQNFGIFCIKLQLIFSGSSSGKKLLLLD